MDLMGRRPDSCNPERVLQPLNLTSIRSDTVTIHHHSPPSLSTENNASISSIPLTHQALQQDDKVHSHPSTFHAEYQLHPYQSQIPILSSSPLSLLSSSTLIQSSQITPINHNSGSISSQPPTVLPTSKALKDFMTEFQSAEELDVVDDVEQVESDIMLTGYDGLQSHELRDNVDAITP